MTPYDDGHFRSTKKIVTTPRSWTGWLGTAIVAAVVGAGATWAFLPPLISSGMITLPVAMTTTTPVMDPIKQPLHLSMNDAIVTAVKQATPSVVGIINIQNSANGYVETGVGSGVIFDARGFIVTNYHVIQGATQVEIVLHNQSHVYASVVGYDAYTDLAVLKIPSSYITTKDVAQFGDSSTLQVGEPAIAIGNPAGLDFTDSVTVGVISATQRTMPVQDEATGQVIGQENVLQTDAAINPGNSGGPLLNIAGQVIGINSSKIVAKGFEGMGFSIPINEVRTITRQIMVSGQAQHPAIGIEGESLSAVPQQYQPDVPVKQGVWVFQVTGASAKKAGIRHGDVIVAVDGTPIMGITDLRSVLWQNKQPGQWVTVTWYRGQTKMQGKIQLGELPPLQSQGTTTGSNQNSSPYTFFGGVPFP